VSNDQENLEALDLTGCETDDNVPFGLLVVEAGWITRKQLEQARTVSSQVSVPLGRVLTMRGWMTEREVAAAIEIQALIRDGFIDLEGGLKVLKLIGWTSLSVGNALATIGIDIDELPKSENRLGALMVSAKYATDDEVESGLTISQGTGLPLGKSLILKGVVTPAQVEAVLIVQKLIRNEIQTREFAVSALQRIADDNKKVITADSEQLDRQLAELLVIVDIVNQFDMSRMLEAAKLNKWPLSDMLILFSLVPYEVLKTAIAICNQVEQGALTLESGAHALRLFHARGIPFAEAMNTAETDSDIRTTPTTLNFLKALGVISEEDIAQLIEHALCDTHSVKKFIVQTNMLDERTVNVTTRLKFLVDQKELTLEQAKKAYDTHLKTNTIPPNIKV
jgi:hypothetical protein